MLNKLKQLFKKEKGQGLVEYGLILALISVLSIGAVSSVGEKVSDTFKGITHAIDQVVLAEDSDFVWVPFEEDTTVDPYRGPYYATNEVGRGYYHYQGGAEAIEIPHEINGHPMTNYSNMFRGSTVRKVVSTNPKVISMRWTFSEVDSPSLDLSDFDTSSVVNMTYMFRDIKSDSLDLRGLDTSKVRFMGAMFMDAQIDTLDLSTFNTSSSEHMIRMFQGANIQNMSLESFDTQNVTMMTGMFEGNKSKVLDLGSFDTSTVDIVDSMFFKSEATTGYAKSNADAAVLNGSSGKPEGLNFIVKPGGVE